MKKLFLIIIGMAFSNTVFSQQYVLVMNGTQTKHVFPTKEACEKRISEIHNSGKVLDSDPFGHLSPSDVRDMGNKIKEKRNEATVYKCIPKNATKEPNKGNVQGGLLQGNQVIIEIFDINNGKLGVQPSTEGHRADISGKTVTPPPSAAIQPTPSLNRMSDNDFLGDLENESKENAPVIDVYEY
jgi:hypothetical protein